jgi:hypothetical protein
MSKRERVVVRVLFACGIASSLALSAWAIQAEWIAAGLFFGTLALLGGVLFWGTPVAV